MEHKGEIAKLRRMIQAYDMCLSLCETDEALGIHEYRAVQALIDATMRARECAANILCRYGDDSAYKSTPTIKLTVKM